MNKTSSNVQAQPTGFTAQIRDAAASVMANACHVKIRAGLIPAYTAKILAKYPVITKLDDFHFLSETSPQQTAAYVLALDSINFGSGYFDVARKSGVALEYQIIAEGLKRAFQSGRMNTPAKWAEASPLECHDIFGIPAGTHMALDQLMQHVSRHLRASGDIITAE